MGTRRLEFVVAGLGVVKRGNLGAGLGIWGSETVTGHVV